MKNYTYYIDDVNGSDKNDGLTIQKPFKTIQKAADAMYAGDACLIRSGIYREKILPPRGGTSENNRITYKAYPGEKPIIKGSSRVVSWVNQGNGLWKAELPDVFFSSSRYNPFTTIADGACISNPKNWTLGMVYLNDEPFSERIFLSECINTPKTWYSLYKLGITSVYANFDKNPNEEMVEVNVRDTCFEPLDDKLGYITIQGLTLKQAAPQWNGNGYTQQGIISARWAYRWIIEDCNISDSPCAGVALACVNDDSNKEIYPYNEFGFNIVRNNTIERCGQAGIDGHKVGHSALIEGNLIQDINWQLKLDGAEQAGIKLHLATDVVIKNNIIRRIYGNNETIACIWLDWANQGARVTGNILYDFCGSGRDNFILYLEANAGPITVDNNIFIARSGYKNILKLGCFNVVFVHNLIYQCEVIHNNDESRFDPWFKPHEISYPYKGNTGDGFPSTYYNMNNIYINSSTNYNGKNNLMYSEDCNFCYSDTSDGVKIIFSVDSQPEEISCQYVSSDYIGMFMPMNQGMEDMYGNKVNIDQDIRNYPRKTELPCVGPFEDIVEGINSYTFTNKTSGDNICFKSPKPRKFKRINPRRPVAMINESFCKGDTSGWKTFGNVEIIKNVENEETYCLKLGPGVSSARQVMFCTPNTIYKPILSSKVSEEKIEGKLTIKYYDSKMNLLGTPHLLKITSLVFEELSKYHLSPALARYMEIIIGNESEIKGEIYAKEIIVKDEIPLLRNPLVNIDEYMVPMFKTNELKRTTRQYDEAVLLYSTEGGAAIGNLLHYPERIVSVRDFSILKNFSEGKDYIVDGKTIIRVGGSNIPYKKDTDFSNEKYDFYRIQGSHILVTYDYSSTESWQGPSIAYCGDKLPNTMRKLINKEPLTIVAYGDSITFGHNTSNTDGIAPFIPCWVDLFADQLKDMFGYEDINLINAAQPGQTCDWGAEQVHTYVTPYDPDLVTVSFGMNDQWKTDGEPFKAAMQIIIDKVKDKCPNAEIVFISSMMYDLPFNPEGGERMGAYDEALKSLEGIGIQVNSMYSISQYLYRQKKIKDFVPNPLHPNDYLTRWYAQTLVAMFDNR